LNQRDRLVGGLPTGDIFEMNRKGRPRDFERKRRVKAVPRGTERYRKVVEDLTEVICRFKADGTLTFVNEVYCRFFGKTRRVLLGKKWQPRAVAEDVPKIEARLRTLSAANPVVVIENRVHAGSGEVRWMQFVNRAFFDAAGRLVETQSVGRDITERKQMEEALRETGERYRAIFERSRDAVFLLDFAGRFVDANAAALQMLGYARNEVASTTLGDLLTSEADLRRAHRAIQEVLTTGSETNASEYQLRRKDGALIWVEQQASLVCREGRPFAIQGIARDITEQKRLSETLQLSEARYRSQIGRAHV